MSRNSYLSLLALLLLASFFPFAYTAPAPREGQAATAEFGGVSLTLDYATTNETRERGLGGRESVPENYGMLFVFPSDDRYGFLMKDMLVSLDIFWLDNKGQVVYIAENAAPSTYPSVFYPTVPARYVLETAAGFARAHSVVLGTPLLLKSFERVTK